MAPSAANRPVARRSGTRAACPAVPRTRAGTPQATAPAGMSLVTMEPAPIRACSPMVTPARMTEPEADAGSRAEYGRGQVGLASVRVAPGHLLIVDRADARAEEHPVGQRAGTSS